MSTQNLKTFFSLKIFKRHIQFSLKFQFIFFYKIPLGLKKIQQTCSNGRQHREHAQQQQFHLVKRVFLVDFQILQQIITRAQTNGDWLVGLPKLNSTRTARNSGRILRRYDSVQSAGNKRKTHKHAHAHSIQEYILAEFARRHSARGRKIKAQRTEATKERDSSTPIWWMRRDGVKPAKTIIRPRSCVDAICCNNIQTAQHDLVVEKDTVCVFGCVFRLVCLKICTDICTRANTTTIEERVFAFTVLVGCEVRSKSSSAHEMHEIY